jgi:tetratricopeptide (TPR) repeat protein
LDLCNWNNSKIIANYVEALRVFGYNQNAYEVVEKYIKIFSNESFLYFNYATLEHNNGNHEHALELYISGLNINPNYIPAWHACGKILNTMNTPYALQESENLMRQALRIHSSSAIINYILGESLQMQNKLDEALHYLRIAYELYPSDYHTNAHLATTYHVLGERSIHEGIA